MYIDDAGGGVIGATIGKSMADFASAAASGSIEISEEGGEALLTAIRDLRDWIDENRTDIEQLNREPKLGSSSAAGVMKPYVADVARDSQGFITNLMKLRESLVAAEKGIQDAMRNYQATDQLNAAKLR